MSDIYRPWVKWRRGHPASATRCLILGRVLTILLIVAAGLIAPVIDQFETIYSAMQTMFSLFQSPTLALLILGIFWRRTNTTGAIVGLVTGVLLASALNLVGGSLFPSKDPFLFVAFWAFIYSLVVTALVSRFTAPPLTERLRGLVWGWIEIDEETQKLLRERLHE